MSFSKWIKENIVQICWMVIIAAGSVVTTYYALRMQDRDIMNQLNEQNARLHNLNERVQNQDKNWDSLIERLDKRYINEKEFEEFRRSMEQQIQGIDSNVQYLIRLEIENRK